MCRAPPLLPLSLLSAGGAERGFPPHNSLHSCADRLPYHPRSHPQVVPDAAPPVVRFMEVSKYLYEQVRCARCAVLRCAVLR